MNRVNSIDSTRLAYKSHIETLPNVRKVASYQTFVGHYQDPKNGVGVANCSKVPLACTPN